MGLFDVFASAFKPDSNLKKLIKKFDKVKYPSQRDNFKDECDLTYIYYQYVPPANTHYSDKNSSRYSEYFDWVLLIALREKRYSESHAKDLEKILYDHLMFKKFDEERPTFMGFYKYCMSLSFDYGKDSLNGDDNYEIPNDDVEEFIRFLSYLGNWIIDEKHIGTGERIRKLKEGNLYY